MGTAKERLVLFLEYEKWYNYKRIIEGGDSMKKFAIWSAAICVAIQYEARPFDYIKPPVKDKPIAGCYRMIMKDQMM